MFYNLYKCSCRPCYVIRGALFRFWDDPGRTCVVHLVMRLVLCLVQGREKEGLRVHELLRRTAEESLVRRLRRTAGESLVRRLRRKFAIKSLCPQHLRSRLKDQLIVL